MARIALPDAPAVVAGHGRAAIFTADGELLLLPAAEAAARLRALPPPLLIHAPATFRRLGPRIMPAFDLLELFAFVLPARTAAPTPRGLALALDFDPPHGGLEAEAAMLPELVAAMLHRLVQGARHRAEPRRGRPRGPDGPSRLGLGAVRHRRTRPPGRRAIQRGAARLEAPAGMGGRRPAAAAIVPPGLRCRSSLAPCRHAWSPRRTATRPGRLCRRRGCGIRAARDPWRSASGAGRGWHRHRQDARLSGTGQPVVGEEPRQRLDQHLHPSPAAPDRRRTGPFVPRPVRASQARRGPKGPRELPVPAQSGGCTQFVDRGHGAGVTHPAWPGHAVGAGHQRRRHSGRRPARLAVRAVWHRLSFSPWPIGAASASTPLARIGAAALSNTPSVAPAPLSLSSRTMPW